MINKDSRSIKQQLDNIDIVTTNRKRTATTGPVTYFGYSWKYAARFL
jgi:hypothetical protein